MIITFQCKDCKRSVTYQSFKLNKTPRRLCSECAGRCNYHKQSEEIHPIADETIIFAWDEPNVLGY